MNLNLLLNPEDFNWEDISLDKSKYLENAAELLEVLMEEEDIAWHHPSIYSYSFAWGNIFDFVFQFDYPTAKKLTNGWMKHRHYNTLKNLWKFCRDQREPFCKNVEDLVQHPDHCLKLNGLLTSKYEERTDVDSIRNRYELQIHYCSSRTELINWEKSKHYFLPNMHYSNLFLAEELGVPFSTDLKEKKLEVYKYAKEYCDSGYKKHTKGRSKEANAAKVGAEVARRNFYTEEIELGISEEKLRGKSMRKIFSLKKDGKKLYLSIDFEKGNAYEFCDSKGKHMGEFRFDGQENGAVGSTIDKSGEHDIWALR